MSVIMLVVDLWQYLACCRRSGVTRTLALGCALHVQYVPVGVTHSALVVHRYTDASPRCKTLQYLKTFIPLSLVPVERSC